MLHLREEQEKGREKKRKVRNPKVNAIIAAKIRKFLKALNITQGLTDIEEQAGGTLFIV